MQPSNSLGSFLVRNSETRPGNYSLSIRARENVRHYHIEILEDGTLSIARGVTFKAFDDLIAYYSEQPRGLCTKLKQPCLTFEKLQTAGLSKYATDEWEIKRSQIRLLCKLGTGVVWDMWEGIWNCTTPVAVKTMKPGTLSPQKFLQEAELMKKFHHSNLLQLYAMCIQEQPYYIITELMKHGTLLDYLKGEGRSLKLPQFINISAQVASGMAYLVEQNYIHRDLGARNILVGDHMICKVANFYLTQVIDDNTHETPMGVEFSIRWTAPEAVMRKHFTFKSDVWSFGIVIYETITYGESPYPSMTDEQILQALKEGYRMPRPMGYPNKLYNIMLDCWQLEPAYRPTFETLQRQLEQFFTASDGDYQ